MREMLQILWKMETCTVLIMIIIMKVIDLIYIVQLETNSIHTMLYIVNKYIQFGGHLELFPRKLVRYGA